MIGRISRTVIAGMAIAVFSIIFSPIVKADNGRLIDNPIFDNYGSMTEANIQNFINSFPNSCLIQSNYPGGLSPVTFKEPLSYYDYSSNDVSPARIIWKASQLYGLNPQVLLATLEKEQNFVTGNGGCGVWRYNSAMGYNCPDGSENNLKNYPNLGVTNTCVAKEANVTFSRQVNHAAWQFVFDRQRAEGNVMWSEASEPDPNINYGTVYVGRMTEGFRKTSIYDSGRNYDGWTTIDGVAVYLYNGATAALYNYTPHFNNFSTIFKNWFGDIYAYIHNGLSYTDIFDASYYLDRYPDLQQAYGDNKIYAFNHFIDHGMSEGRQAKSDFNVTTYRNRYQDLRTSFGTNLTRYYQHYLTNGKAEGRSGAGEATIQYITSYNGTDYSSIYDFTTYTSLYADMQQKYYNDDYAALKHFVNQGISEGRQASSSFSAQSYQGHYYDLRRAFGTNIKQYYLHYLTNGKAEGRSGTGNYLGGIAKFNGTDYSAVYNFNDYATSNPDVKNVFNLDDIATLHHFINYGMSEGRQASNEFNVHVYKARYPDLQNAFGNQLKLYYLHFMTNGKAEGRSGV